MGCQRATPLAPNAQESRASENTQGAVFNDASGPHNCFCFRPRGPHALWGLTRLLFRTLSGPSWSAPWAVGAVRASRGPRPTRGSPTHPLARSPWPNPPWSQNLAPPKPTAQVAHKHRPANPSEPPRPPVNLAPRRQPAQPTLLPHPVYPKTRSTHCPCPHATPPSQPLRLLAEPTCPANLALKIHQTLRPDHVLFQIGSGNSSSAVTRATSASTGQR